MPIPEELSPRQIRNLFWLMLAIVLAVIGTEAARLGGIGAGGVIMLFLISGTVLFAVLSRQSQIFRTLTFGVSFFLYNGVRNVDLDSEYLLLGALTFVGFPVLVALIALGVRRSLKR